MDKTCAVIMENTVITDGYKVTYLTGKQNLDPGIKRSVCRNKTKRGQNVVGSAISISKRFGEGLTKIIRKTKS